MGVHLHRLAEARSLALHEAIAEALRADPSLVDVARRRMRAWKASGHVASAYAERWLALLDAPLDDLCRTMTLDDEAMRALRQTTPFAGIIDPRTRWRLWDEVRARMETSTEERSR